MSLYRCVECGHGQFLRAWFIGLAEGTVEPDGSMGVELQHFEDTELQESSLACQVHGDTVTIEKREGDHWCRAFVCPHCDHGMVNRGSFYQHSCERCRGKWSWWQPVKEAIAT